MYIGENYIGVI